jgi:transcriptional regulator with XRE-family HTH domain
MSKLMQFLEENTKPKISALKLAQKLKVHPSLITLWRLGQRKPGKGKIKQLSKVTGIAVEDLL